jgi:hypothetical protein
MMLKVLGLVLLLVGVEMKEKVLRNLTTIGMGYNIYEGNPLFFSSADTGLKISG